MNTSEKPTHYYPKLSYTLTSTMLMMPVILWPAPILLFENPMLPDVLTPTWLFYSAILLISAVCIDTMLYGINTLKQAIDATLWISVFAILSVNAVQSQGGSWLLAILFFIHSLRAGYRLFQVTTPVTDAPIQWWLWLAWSRDTAAALILLGWGSMLVVY